MRNDSKVTRLRTPDEQTGPAGPGKKRENFRRLAERRTNRALEAVLLIGNLSNRHVYDYEDGDIRKIVKALRDAVAAVEARFGAPQARTGARFKL